MQREYKIITELSKNNLKVPNPIHLCTDKNISQDDFYIMEYIDGETIADNSNAENYSKKDKELITNSFVTTLTELHNFDVQSSGLKDLGKHEGYVERQLIRWNKQFSAQKVREINDLDVATNILLEKIPTQQRVSIVHGDYRLDNVRVKDNNVAAVLDWELCTLGDPLADLGTVIASWADKKEKDTPFIYSPSLSGGFPSRDKILNLYEENSQLNLNEIEFYVRLSFWKHAMIMEGVYVRYSLGYYGNVDKKEVEAFGESTLSFAHKASAKNLLKEIF
jgi:aminoglycoside phosphotransferase (APT) family kinase protein